MSDQALINAFEAMHAYNRNPSDRDALVLAKCRGLMFGYHHRWIDGIASYRVLEVEKARTAAVVNPETGRTSRSFLLAGKIDVNVFQISSNRDLIVDHKTTSSDIGPDSPYWRQLVVEAQPTHYMLLEWQNRRKHDGALWDVVKKPGIKPRALTKAEVKEIAHTGMYFGREVSEQAKALAAQPNAREDHELYEARLAHSCTIEKPNEYFARQMVPRLDGDVVKYAKHLWQHGQNILASRKLSLEQLPPNSGACMLYGTPCKFLGLCSGHDRIDSGKWVHKAQRHPELGPGFENIDALTNSRVRTHQTCAVKHYYEYELMIERYDEEEKEALYFGNVWHAGLEAWWKTFLGDESDGNGTTDGSAAPSNEAAGATAETYEWANDTGNAGPQADDAGGHDQVW